MACRSVPGPLSAFEVTQRFAASLHAGHADNANTTARTRRTSDGIRQRITDPSRSRAPEREESGQPNVPGVVRHEPIAIIGRRPQRLSAAPTMLARACVCTRSAMMGRPQQRYDHRLRDLVQRTGDLSIATAHVSRSTARGWLIAV
jgi:hypothetical protein